MNLLKKLLKIILNMKMLHSIKKVITFLIVFIFGIIAALLHLIGKVFNFTYNETNILVYYLIIPLSWSILLDIIINIPLFTILISIIWIYIFYTKRKFFKEWCNVVFDISVIFLLKFQKIGWNYYTSSVIICVIIPVIIYLLLISAAL